MDNCWTIDAYSCSVADNKRNITNLVGLTAEGKTTTNYADYTNYSAYGREV